jgi:hypothetical protein
MCIQSASREAQHLHAQGRVREAAKLLQSSIVLLTTMARRIAGREGQLTLLSLFPGLAGDAALVVLDDSHALSQALQLLELGRSIINATTMDYRTQLMESDHEEYPDIVRRFNQLRMEVDVGTHSDTLTTAADAAAWARRQADVQIELNSLLEEVRCLPRYANTLGPQSPHDWMSLADGGPIGRSSITLLSFPHLDYTEAHCRMDDVFRITHCPPSTFANRNQTIHDHLCWISNVAVQPILQELSLSHPGMTVNCQTSVG